ncbi:MAG: hypothetical protein NT007_09930 [Candidatus Kapabacteria bacterium]|nr:hypothetical protein [Candidatus Kapabacteria bacterium]
MKKIYLIIGIIIGLSGAAGAQWEACNNGLQGNGINSVAIIGQTIFTGTNNGIYLTTDFGDNWLHPSLGGIDSNIHSMIAIKNKIIIGTNNGIYISTDNGFNWFEKDSGLISLQIQKLAILRILSLLVQPMDIYRFQQMKESRGLQKKPILYCLLLKMKVLGFLVHTLEFL